MNHVMTAGLDRRWRRLAVEAVVRPGDRVLDACCGTGDLAIAAARRGRRRSSGLDFSQRMLDRARAQVAERRVGSRATCSTLPFADGAFDAATVGFGVRNVADLERGARASCGACSGPAGGSRFSRSRSRAASLKPFFSLWFDRVVPLLGKLLPGGKAYTYLPASVRRFPGAEELAGVHGDVRLRETSSFRAPRRQDRRPPHRGRRRDDDGRHARDGQRARRVSPDYLEAVEERLARDDREPSRSRRGGRRRRARRGRQAAAARARLSLGARRTPRRRSRPVSRSSSSTRRRSSTTT